jgi:hypothetical protein
MAEIKISKTALAISLIVAITVSGIIISPLFVYAQNFQYVVGTDYYAPTDSTLPQKGVAFTDPDFHTTIVRVTDKADGYTGPGIENEYSQVDAENSDGTLVALRGNDAELYLYDATTFQMKKHFESSFTYGEEPEPRWDPTNPNVFFYLYGTELRTYNVNSDFSALVHDLKTDYPAAEYISTHSYGSPSLDGRYWSFIIRDIDYNFLSVAVYDKQADTIVGHQEAFPDDVRGISMDVSGNHCVVSFESHVLQVCFRDFSSIKDLPTGANGHNDFALTTDGRDVAVYQNTQNDYICMADLDTTVETRLLPIPFEVNSDIGLHISGNSADKPGWVLVSTYGAKQAPPDETHSWMDTQLFMLQLQENPAIWRVAHTQAYLYDEPSDEKNFFAEAFATINRAGTRVYFGSNWANFTPDYSDTYQVTLPNGWTSITTSSDIPTPSQTPISSPTQMQTQIAPEGSENNIDIITFAIAVIATVTVVIVATVLLIRRSRRTGKT